MLRVHQTRGVSRIMKEYLEGTDAPLIRATSSSGEIRPCLGIDGHQQHVRWRVREQQMHSVLAIKRSQLLHQRADGTLRTRAVQQPVNQSFKLSSTRTLRDAQGIRTRETPLSLSLSP